MITINVYVGKKDIDNTCPTCPILAVEDAIGRRLKGTKVLIIGSSLHLTREYNRPIPIYDQSLDKDQTITGEFRRISQYRTPLPNKVTDWLVQTTEHCPFRFHLDLPIDFA